ncbi:dioxygenase family protein [Variovorax sp. PvP013]|uniref:dioxygenase family protein n=1 Tax=Variovorax sp. PvP013 TaxID=3156435 RepID=UPI003D1E591A
MQAPANPLARRHADATRRRALGALGSLGVIALTGCGGGDDATASGTATTTGAATTSTTTASTASTTATTATTSGRCAAVPEETAGPYPADGSQASGATYNVLALSGIVRSDIRTSIGGTVAAGGVPLTLRITLTDTAACAPLSGCAIYLWHCTREGTYSVYTTHSIGENHLRGVQPTDAGGVATFTTVVPGCYAGRMPHMHLEIYRSVAAATGAGNKLRTTQLAFPTDVLKAVYAAAPGYSQSTANLDAISFATDNVFSDGTSLEMTSLSGNVTDGYVATISISIAA